MQLITRNYSLFSEESQLEDLYEIINTPLFMGCTTKDQSCDIFVSQKWQIDKDNGLIQLKEIVPLDQLYPEAHNAGVVGAIWAKHHESFADFLLRHNPKSILEIGGSHGILCEKFSQNQVIPWTIIDLNPIENADISAKFIKAEFDSSFVFNEFFDTIVHSHVFEHFYEPVELLGRMYDILPSGGKLIFSIPNMRKMLECKYSNCLNLEHTFFITEVYMEWLLSKFNFEVVDKEYYLEDHSIFFAAVKKDTAIDIDLPRGLYEENKTLFLDYIQYYKDYVAELNQTINQKVYLFGAHIFSQNLFTFGLDSENIIAILDNDQDKQGKRLYGTSLIVFSPDVIANDDRPIVVLKAGVYNAEIKAQLLRINPDCEFI